MITIGQRMRILLSLVLVIDLMLFSSMTGLTVIAMVIGAIAIILGIGYSYKPSAIIGLLIVSVTAAAAMELSTLLEMSTLMSAVFGLLIPVILLTWLILSSEDEEHTTITIARVPTIMSIIYALLCVVSVPLIAFVVSLFAPTTTMRLAVATEIAVLGIVTLIGAVALTYKKPSKTRDIEAAEEGPETA